VSCNAEEPPYSAHTGRLVHALVVFFGFLGALFKDALIEWWYDSAIRLAASVTFYTIFSLAPLVIITISIAGAVFGEAAARGQLLSYVEQFTGPEAAGIIQVVIQNAHGSRSGLFYTVIGIAVLLLGATAVFAELQHALNRVWEVESPGGIRNTIVDRLLSFLMVLGVGGLLVVALLVSTGLAVAAAFLEHTVPFLPYVFFLFNIALPFGIVTLLFAMFYKVLPDVRIGWADVWVGALLTAGLFVIGNFLLGFYLSRGSLASVYGAAGSFVVFLLWIYYSVQIFLLGAELTHAYASRLGTKIVPARGAVAIEPKKQTCPQSDPHGSIV